MSIEFPNIWPELTEDQVARINEKTLCKHMEKVDEELLSIMQLDVKCPDEASKFAVLNALRVNKSLSCKMQPGAEYSEDEIKVIRDQINNDVSKEMIAEGMEVLMEEEW